MTLQVLSWFAFALTITGYEFIVRKKWQGHVIWTCTNFFWIGFNLYLGTYAQSLMFAVFCYYTTRGLLRWRKEIALEKREHEALENLMLDVRYVVGCQVFSFDEYLGPGIRRMQNSYNELLDANRRKFQPIHDKSLRGRHDENRESA